MIPCFPGPLLIRPAPPYSSKNILRAWTLQRHSPCMQHSPRERAKPGPAQRLRTSQNSLPPLLSVPSAIGILCILERRGVKPAPERCMGGERGLEVEVDRTSGAGRDLLTIPDPVAVRLVEGVKEACSGPPTGAASVDDRLLLCEGGTDALSLQSLLCFLQMMFQRFPVLMYGVEGGAEER